jgi:hypothetical protein
LPPSGSPCDGTGKEGGEGLTRKYLAFSITKDIEPRENTSSQEQTLNGN